MHIVFVQTGGTIDKDYPSNDDNHGYLFEIGGPSFKTILGRVKPEFDFDMLSILRKDSLDINEADRAALLDVISNNPHERFIITHGTDTIAETARTLSSIRNKTIVLTGAFLPEKFYDSDAEFNLGMAVSAVQVVPHGVYIALCGNIVAWEDFVSK